MRYIIKLPHYENKHFHYHFERHIQLNFKLHPVIKERKDQSVSIDCSDDFVNASTRIFIYCGQRCIRFSPFGYARPKLHIQNTRSYFKKLATFYFKMTSMYNKLCFEVACRKFKIGNCYVGAKVFNNVCVCV